MNNKKQLETYLYSTVGAAVMVVIVIALNVILRPVVKRIDLTKDKLYTLSEGTRRILGRIDTPVQIRFYFSQSDPATPVEFKTYATRVEDLLNEYKLHAKGNLEVKKLDPQPDSDAEDSASVDGVEGQPLSPLGGDKIDDDVQVLLVIYPKGISEVTQYAIDQFVLRGGKLVAFLDPLSIMDTRSMNPQNPLQGAANSGASLDLLLKAWGLSFDISKVVADKEYFTEMGGEGGRPQVNPSVLQLPAKAVDTNDVVTSQISRLFLPFAGTFAGSPVEGLKQTVLLRSSVNADLTEKMLAQFGGAGQDFKASGKDHPLAVRLTGKFKTAFPEGKPGEKGDTKGEKKEGEE